MEENTAAVESMILFYINTKQLLKTKQLDERVFLDQMIKHCRENGFDTYSNEEMRNTWKNLVLKYVELKKSGSVEERECWKYYEILDSCYEQSDFHNGVYPKFSEEMVWFLIECFLKRRGLEKTQKRNSMLNEIHKDFLRSGYLYITKQDIENKWKYLNVKYDKLKDDHDAFSKLPYLQAVTRFREKEGKCLVKIIFTRELTEILIERFTEKKITCVIHGYDSEQVLSEIQSEFRDLGFDFTQEEIKEKWRKLTNIYSFIKAKGKDDSSWVYFNAMKEHFKDDFLFEFGRMGSENVSKEDEYKFKPASRPRSKSMSADSRIKLNNNQIKSNLVVNIEQLNKNILSTVPEKKSDGQIMSVNKNKSSAKRPPDDDAKDLRVPSKKLKSRPKSKENTEKTENTSLEVERSLDKNINETEPKKMSVHKKHEGIMLKKNIQLTRLTIDQNGNQERRGSVDLGSPGSKVHIINIDGSEIDKTNGNLTINLPSITKQFSDNEFLPLKKRLRLGGHYGDKQSEGNEIKDGFLGFPATEVAETRDRLKSDSNECKRLTEEEMAEIMERINVDQSEKYGISNALPNEDTAYFKPDGFNYNYLGPYTNFNQPCLIIPKEEHKDNLPLQNYNNPNAITPPPVLLLVIKVDGSNSLSKDGAMNEVTKEIEKRLKDSPVKNKPGQSTSVSSVPEINTGSSPEFVKPVSSNGRNCTITHNKNITITPIAEVENNKASDIQKNDQGKMPVSLGNPASNPGNANHAVAENVKVLSSESEEMKSSQACDIQVKDNGMVKLTSPKGKSCTISLNDKVVVVQSADIKNNEEPPRTEVSVTIEASPSPKKNEQSPKSSETVPVVAAETNTTAPSVHQQADTPKSIRLPVKGGGKVKEIFISSQELKKISQLKPENFKLKKNISKPVNIPQNTSELIAAAKSPPKIKFVSHTIKPPRVEAPANIKAGKAPLKPRSRTSSTIDLTADDNQMLPPSTSLAAPNKFPGTNNSSNAVNRTMKNDEFDNESVFSEAVGDDDGLKDNLLATVIDFQEQNNQEFVEIKNLMKQNNLLQRETNRLLRLMLEKM